MYFDAYRPEFTFIIILNSRWQYKDFWHSLTIHPSITQSCITTGKSSRYILCIHRADVSLCCSINTGKSMGKCP